LLSIVNLLTDIRVGAVENFAPLPVQRKRENIFESREKAMQRPGGNNDENPYLIQAR
jgi:hypothetical protein